MPIDLDITSPENNQLVGTAVCVTGSYSDDDGPFVIECRMKNDAVGFDKTQFATVNTQEGTWQATFADLAPSVADNKGSYTVSASAGPAFSNPVVGVEVTDDPGFDVDDQFRVITLRDRGRKVWQVTVTGTYPPGSGLGKGYVANARLTLGGLEISEAGRLHRMEDGRWECQFRVYPLPRVPPDGDKPKTAILHAELWRVNTRDPNTKPVVTIAKEFPI